MKKLFILALTLVTIQVTAQQQMNKEGKNHKSKFENMTPEQAATTQTKKMTLALDLTEVQQEKIQKLNLENAKQRKATMEAHKSMKESGEFQKLSDEQKMDLKNARLDKQIARKKQMKEILDEKQYEKFSEKMAQNQKRKKEKIKSYKNNDCKKMKSE